MATNRIPLSGACRNRHRTLPDQAKRPQRGQRLSGLWRHQAHFGEHREDRCRYV